MQRVELYHYKATQSEREYRNALESARSAQQKASQTRTVAQAKKEQLWKEISSLKSSPSSETTAQEMWKNGGAARLEVASREFRQAASVDKKAAGELAQSMQQVQRASVKRDLSQALYGAEKKRVVNGRERIREEEIMDLGIVQRVQGQGRSERSPTMQREGAMPQLTTQQPTPPLSQQVESMKVSDSDAAIRNAPVAVVAAHLDHGDGKAALRMRCETSSGVPVGMVLSQDGGGGVTVKLSSLSKGMTDQLMLERSAIMSKVSALGIKVNKIEVQNDAEGVELDTQQSGMRARSRRSAEEEDESVIA